MSQKLYTATAECTDQNHFLLTFTKTFRTAGDKKLLSTEANKTCGLISQLIAPA